MDDIEKLTIRELQNLLKIRGLPIYYRVKTDLITRLRNFSVPSESEYSSDSADSRKSSEDDNTEREDKNKGITNKVILEDIMSNDTSETVENSNKPASGESINNNTVITNQFVFRDIEESLEKFSGEGNKSIVFWLKEFEDIASVCSWNNVQRYLYARRLLTGAARLAVESAVDLKSWPDLKKYLLKEFGENFTSLGIHRALENRRKTSNETFLEYAYSMKQLASRGNIDDRSLATYIADGIVDDVNNKVMLYEAVDFEQMKEKLQVYELLKSRQCRNKYNNVINKDKNVKNVTRCSLCGGKGHSATNCNHKSKGPRCFACNEFGHISPKCPKKQESRNSVNLISRPAMHVNVNVNGKNCVGLIDSGSDVTLIKKTLKDSFDIDDASVGPSINLSGFAQNFKSTLGSFETNLRIDNNNFNVKCHVVPDSWISSDILIGKDVLTQATVVIKAGNVVINKIKEDSVNELAKIDMIQVPDEELQNCINDIRSMNIRAEVKKLITNYQPSTPKKSCIEMKIILEDNVPVYEKPRRLSPKDREIVGEQITEWLNEGIVKHSSSDYASPIVLVKKKDGSTRLCVDFRKLNKKVIKDRYPLPAMEDILENLYDSSVFTALDLRNGFFHVDIHPDSTKYTSFITPEGQYEFLKVPFGLCNSPAVFQRFINTIFEPLIRKNDVLVYLDDIIIPAKNEEENLEKLKLVLEIARENGLVIKWKKCKLMKRSIEILGHIIENGSIKPSQEKIKAVKNFPVPKTVKQIQSFLGLTGFFRKFIRDYSRIAKPLSDLLKNDNEFVFGAQQQEAFVHLKELLCADPVLKLFNPRLETELHTDASREGYGAILFQKHEDMQLHPVFYVSFKTTDAEKNYASYELEILSC